MAHEKLRPQFAFDEEKIKQLKQIAPECFEDGKINFETLRQNLGSWTQNEEEKELEHFGLFWPGKHDARRLASIPSKGTLKPIFGEGLKPNGKPDKDGVNDSKNIFIEGENLEVLKILQKSYAGKIKMIYIDPPYNTGNDFIYDDDYTEPLQEYLRRTGQVDEEGKPLTTNKRSDGRFHSKWLSMIYPRLRLARNLLRDDGVIFISIDDNEVHNLRALMNEVFGEENFVTQFIWKSRVSEDTRAVTGASTDHEYILTYFKSSGVSLRGAEKDLEKFANPDNDERGPWRSADLTGLATKDKRPNLHYDLIDPKTKINYGCPPKGWRYERKTMDLKIKEGRILFPASPDGRPRHRLYLNELKSTFKNISTIITSTNTSIGTKEINSLLGVGVFSFPKPSDLVKIFIEQSTAEDDIILDFFAGSGTTAHAVMRQNSDDGGNRKFICVQIPEEVDENEEAHKLGYTRITDITKERIRRVSKNIKVNDGFKVFRLTESNYKHWANYTGDKVMELENDIDLFSQNPLIENWNKHSLLAEIILNEGFTVSSRITLESFKKNQVYTVSDEFCEHNLIVCLDDKIYSETIQSLDLKENDIFICLDSAISNIDKLRLSDKGLIKTI